MSILNPLRAYARLKRRGILCMNSRNSLYISRYNPRHLYPLVDDKLKTKEMALAANVNVPNLIGVVHNQFEVRLLSTLLKGVSGFCVKPAKGSGGKGILVIKGRNEQGQYIKSNGVALDVSTVERHVSNILAGLFSLGGSTDVAVIESLIEVDESFLGFTYEGVPDLRVIVFQGFPVMAMMRLSCSVSHGKANLHQGAVGVGVDIASGQSVRAVQFGKSILVHPDTKCVLKELVVPQWKSMLELASSCYDMCGLGYLGVDLVLDRVKGPLLLELNARPGLSIQLANNSGLLPRLNHVENLEQIPSYSNKCRVEHAQLTMSALG
ncbi:MAG: alpha-L-glutamate ligase-like protein [Flavobacteriales bacterium]